MPRLTAEDKFFARSISPDDVMDDIPPSIPATQRERDIQAGQEAEEQVKQALLEVVKKEKSQAKKGKGSRQQKPEKPVEPENSVNGDDDSEAPGDEFVVEQIVDHMFKGKKCLYRVRWEGYGEDEDTWEPDDHLLPDSSIILAAYHEKIGGSPQPPKQVRKTASKAQLKQEVPATDESEDRAPKRAKRAHKTDSNVMEIGSKEWKAQPLSAWQPSDKNSWEDLVHEVETVERDDEGTLFAYIRFRNGKRSKVANNLYINRCPRAMIRFYETHLNFQSIQPDNV